MIPQSAFIKKMQEQWSEFGNIPSKPLDQAWNQQCEVYNSVIQLSSTSGAPTEFEKYFPNDEGLKKETLFKILQPPTGSGKTLGTIVYASMCAIAGLDYHPGCIIVTRLKQDADAIADRINILSRRYSDILSPDDIVATSYHSDHKLDLRDLSRYPVLVITHRAYVLALDQLNNNSMIEDTWEYFYRWRDGVRKLIVIDEAIDIVEEKAMTLNNIRTLLGFIPQSTRNEFSNEITLLKWFENALEIEEQN